jgi:hypothetical protein
MNAQTEKIQLKGAAGVIEVLRDAAAQGAPALGVAVIAHPHPLFGGTMDNKVVQTLARAFVSCGWTAVRFNFRGVGASEGVHDEGRGEREDMLRVVEQLAPEGPLSIAGFSFGAFVASRAAEALWASRDIRHLVLVGTAASRFSVATLPAEAHERMLVVHGCRWPPSWTGRGRSHFLSQSFPGALISFTDNCRSSRVLLSATFARASFSSPHFHESFP